MLKSLRVSIVGLIIVAGIPAVLGYFAGVEAGKPKSAVVSLKMTQDVAQDSYQTGFQDGVEAARTIKVLSRVHSGERELIGSVSVLKVSYVAEAFSREHGEDGTEYGVKILFDNDFGCANVIIPGYPTADDALFAAESYATTWEGWKGLCD